MIELLMAGPNLPFAVALCVMLVIAVIEGVAMLLGAGLSDVLDSMLPEIDLDVDFDADVSPSTFSRLLGWLRIGRVPALMLLVVLLTAFGLIGLLLQSFANGLLGTYMPAMVAVIPAFFLSLPVVRVAGGALGAIMPTDETDAVYSDTFIGRTATIILGEATLGSSAEAKLTDEHGHTHYVMVEPDIAGTSFPQGSRVLLTEQSGAVFKAIVSNSTGLNTDKV